MFTIYNQKTVTLKLTRHDVCDLLLACSALDKSTDENTKKWNELHDKLKDILDDFDSKNDMQ